MMSGPSPTSSTSASSSLPKIAHGRFKHSAKKLWKDHSNIGIYSNVEKGRITAPDEPPLAVSRNPKPLYRRPVTSPKPFRILHSQSKYGMRNTTSLPSLYAQMSFLANAVRNNDGSTSYRGMCEVGANQRRQRSQTVPSSAPGRLEASKRPSTDLHWVSASHERPMPRILQPTSPRSTNNNWMTSWKSPRDAEPESPGKERSVSNIGRGPHPGIERDRSFFQSIAKKRGQMVVVYEHNGRRHQTLVDPPEPSLPPPQTTSAKGKHSQTSGSSTITSSYASYTESKSKTEFLIRGIGGGRNDSGNSRVPSRYGKDTEIISEVDGAQETTHGDGVDEEDDVQEHGQLEDSQGKGRDTAQDNDGESKPSTANSKHTQQRGVHFADEPDDESIEEKIKSESNFPHDTHSEKDSPEDSDTPLTNTGDTETDIAPVSASPIASARGKDIINENKIATDTISTTGPDNVGDDDKDVCDVKDPVDCEPDENLDFPTETDHADCDTDVGNLDTEVNSKDRDSLCDTHTKKENKE